MYLGHGLSLTRQRRAGKSLLLDQHPGAAAAYSLRKLREDFGSEGAAGPDLSLTNNGVTQVSPLVGAKSGLYDGNNNEYHSLNTSSPFTVSSQDVYMSAWVKTPASVGFKYKGLISLRDPGNSGYEMALNGRTFRFGYSKSGSDDGVASSTDVEDDTVYFLEIWTDLDNLDINFRVNGGSSTTKNLSFIPADPTNGAHIFTRPGKNPAANTTFIYDNVAIEVAPRGSLTLPSRSADIYNGGRGRSVQWYKDNLDLSHVQLLAGYENYTAGSDLTNDYPDNSGITSLTANSDDGTGPGVIAPPTGSAGSFDGSSDLQGGTDEEFRPQSAYTIELWVTLNDLGNDNIFAGTLDTGNKEGWQIKYKASDGQFRVTNRDAADSSYNSASGFSPSTDTWYHLVGVWDGSTIYLYVDGSQVASLSSGLTNSTNDFNIGSRQQNFYHNGKLAPVRFWNGRALTSTEISTLYNSGDGLSLSQIESDHPALLDDLVASYEFDDANDLGNDSFVLDGPVIRVRRGSDNVEREIGFDGNGVVDTQALEDFSNGGDVFVAHKDDQRDGTPTVLAKTTQTEQPKIVDQGTAINTLFDGVDDDLRRSVSISAPATIAFWAKHETGSFSRFQHPVNIADSGEAASAFGFFVDDGSLSTEGDVHYFGFGGASDYNTGININGDTSVHLYVATYDGSTVRTYFDGSETPTSGKSRNISIGSELVIGNKPKNEDDHWNGEVRECIIWDLVLSPDDVSDIYSKGAPTV